MKLARCSKPKIRYHRDRTDPVRLQCEEPMMPIITSWRYIQPRLKCEDYPAPRLSALRACGYRQGAFTHAVQTARGSPWADPNHRRRTLLPPGIPNSKVDFPSPRRLRNPNLGVFRSAVSIHLMFHLQHRLQ